AVSVEAARLLGEVLFGVSAHDLPVLSLVTTVLLGTALVANGFPPAARRGSIPCARCARSRPFHRRHVGLIPAVSRKRTGPIRRIHSVYGGMD
ncbi:MAG TPA: hypothetical protein VF921_08345, partial [Vicinamibacterales bacterium]